MLELAQDLLHAQIHRARQRVADLGPVHRDPDDFTAFFDEDLRHQLPISARRRARACLPRCAFKYFEGNSCPTNALAVREASINLSRSIPVPTPMPCNIATTSSVARLPDAPGAYGQPPSPPAAESIVVIPICSATTQFASAVPCVS